MSKDKKILYFLSVTIVLVLLGALFLPRNNGRIITALLLVISAVAIFFLIKKRRFLELWLLWAQCASFFII